jgi:hypothetical protein
MSNYADNLAKALKQTRKTLLERIDRMDKERDQQEIDDVRSMAYKAGMSETEDECNPYWTADSIDELVDFARLIAKAEREACFQEIKLLLETEREACAHIALQWDKEHPSTNFGGCIARSIRARGQHEQG